MKLFGKWFGKAPYLFGLGAVLPVHDTKATADYYCNKLGFHLDFVDDGHGSVTKCNVGIQFTKAPEGYEPDNHPGWIYIFVENIDALNAKHVANGAEVIQPLGDRDHGMREYEIRDCDGHRIRFGQYL